MTYDAITVIKVYCHATSDFGLKSVRSKLILLSVRSDSISKIHRSYTWTGLDRDRTEVEHPCAQAELNALAITMHELSDGVIEEIRKSYPDDSFFKPIVKDSEHYQHFSIRDGLISDLRDGRLCVPNLK